VSTLLNGYPIDAVASLKYSQKSEITKKPVERGTNLTDDIRTDEPGLEIDGVISDTPMGEVASHPSRAGDDRPTQTAFQFLIGLQGKEIVVDCSLGRFTQMGIANISITRDAKTRKALKFTCSLERVRIEDNNRTTVPSAVPTGLPNFGLSLDKVFNGDKMLWRKGEPPGSSPSTDPPGVITGTEVVQSKKKGIFHLDGTILSTEENQAFIKDLQRDAAITVQRGFGRAKIANEKAGKRIGRMQEILDKKNQQAHAGKHVDPGVLGKR